MNYASGEQEFEEWTAACERRFTSMLLKYGHRDDDVVVVVARSVRSMTMSGVSENRAMTLSARLLDAIETITLEQLVVGEVPYWRGQAEVEAWRADVARRANNLRALGAMIASLVGDDETGGRADTP